LIPALARLSQKVQGQPGIHGEFEASLGYILKPYLKTKFKTNKQKKTFIKLGAVAHAYKPSYSCGRDQEDCSSKSAQTNSSPDPISKKNPSQKWADRVAQGEGPEFKPKYHRKKKKKVIHFNQAHKGPFLASFSLI
jgi:hypothetical protein